jgi:imidazolonepropionase-like amidohydrolase
MADMTVVISGDRITEVGSSGRAVIPRGARVVNATGKYLIPGLWDMHVHFPGFSLHDELVLLVEAGLTPMQALQAARLTPARVLNKAKVLGSIETGKIADVVLLDENPHDIHNTQRIRAVVLNELLDRAASTACWQTSNALLKRTRVK